MEEENKRRRRIVGALGLREYSVNAPPVNPYATADDDDDDDDSVAALREVFDTGSWRIDSRQKRRCPHHNKVVAHVTRYGRDSVYAIARCPYTGLSCLHACAINGYLSLLETLVTAGKMDPLEVADGLRRWAREDRHWRGADALWMARKRGHRDIVAWLAALPKVMEAEQSSEEDARKRVADEEAQLATFMSCTQDLAASLEARRERERRRGIHLEPGDRVRLVLDGLEGTVRYRGPVEYTTGCLVGVELDLPKGKHSGTVKHKQYFACAPNHGLMLFPSDLERLDDEDQPRTGAEISSPTHRALPVVDVFRHLPRPKLRYLWQ
ncbi:hypothetical protein CTAYLR_002154 [Chrysophaeum taylorii]|uniref:CAP-Gly domain-containing protein n=1 Tax=Chrysophaeum taylorii TaxID=2483200 RepID=A0AAD7UP49_9STRA|nr:hypothetical protein CTAYLR_002154 [Chrysophaeum taylorii]